MSTNINKYYKRKKRIKEVLLLSHRYICLEKGTVIAVLDFVLRFSKFLLNELLKMPHRVVHDRRQVDKYRLCQSFVLLVVTSLKYMLLEVRLAQVVAVRYNIWFLLANFSLLEICQIILLQSLLFHYKSRA